MRQSDGPAIKLVGVAERMEVVTTNLSSGQSPGHTTGMSEAWSVFLQSRYKFCGLYECRGTNLINIMVSSVARLLVILNKSIDCKKYSIVKYTFRFSKKFT